MFFKKNTLSDKILASTVQQAPFPHSVTDNFLDSSVIESVRQNWPNFSLFHADNIHSWQELPYSLQLGLPTYMEVLSVTQKQFWGHFFHDAFPEIIRAVFIMYGNNFRARYSESLSKIEMGPLMLMESHNQALKMPIHVHYFHSPTWLFNFLIYIDDNGQSDRGTSLYGLPDVDIPRYPDIDRLAGQAINAERGPLTSDTNKLVLRKSIEFRDNRLVTCVDSPYSFHGIEPSAQGNPKQRRRVIRAHIQAPVALTQKLYSMPADSFLERSRRTVDLKEDTAWMNHDIRAHIDNPPKGAVRENLNYARNIEFPNFEDYL